MKKNIQPFQGDVLGTVYDLQREIRTLKAVISQLLQAQVEGVVPDLTNSDIQELLHLPANASQEEALQRIRLHHAPVSGKVECDSCGSTVIVREGVLQQLCQFCGEDIGELSRPAQQSQHE